MNNDLPIGYRWATEDEMDRPDAIAVKRTADSTGVAYTHGEADIAVPLGVATLIAIIETLNRKVKLAEAQGIKFSEKT